MWPGTKSSIRGSTQHAGFSLIELLIVLAIIGAIAAAVLPNIGLTMGSQMSLALRDFSTQMRTVFDSAILTGRIHRMVLDMKQGEYWPEAAPLGFLGRPPLPADLSKASAFSGDDRAKLIEELDTAAAEPRPAGEDGERNYAFRSILVNQRNALKPTMWSEVSDAVLSRRRLPGQIRFAALATEIMRSKKLRSEFEDAEKGYIYFFPDGVGTQATIQFGVEGDAEVILEDGPQFTIFLDPLTGRSQLLEGFQDAEFIKD